MTNPIKAWWDELNPIQRRDVINGIILTVKYILIIIFFIYLINKYL
jgi:hypothetical protein